MGKGHTVRDSYSMASAEAISSRTFLPSQLTCHYLSRLVLYSTVIYCMSGPIRTYRKPHLMGCL